MMTVQYCVLEVDLEYPKESHELCDDQLKIADDCNISFGNVTKFSSQICE